MDSYTFFGHIVGIVGFNQSMLAQIELSGLGVLPEMNHRLAEKVQVMLTCHLAQACHIPEAVAHRIFPSCMRMARRGNTHQEPSHCGFNVLSCNEDALDAFGVIYPPFYPPLNQKAP